ncbi:MAG: MHS family MFS transporter [Bacteroidetes bacterium]|nr:MHS family MFS transporter [Bacteroidota bacterium]
MTEITKTNRLSYREKRFNKKEIINKKIIAAFLGTIIEYYDYSLYGFSAGIIASEFFIKTNKISSLLYAFAIYSISYFSKPLGALFFSKIGDKYGRKLSLKISLIGMGIPTILIGFLPNYKIIGVFASLFLIIYRFLQGFFISGQYSGAAIYVIEHVKDKYRYITSALTRTSAAFGLGLGLIITDLCNSSMVFFDWCWRIPFLLSAPFCLIVIYFSKYLEETPEYIKSINRNKNIPSTLSLLKNRWQDIIKVIFLSGGFGVTYKGTIVLMKDYLPRIFPEIKPLLSGFSLFILLSFCFSMPVAGFLADRFDRQKIIKWGLYSALVSITILSLSINLKLINLVLISNIMLAISIAPFNALAHGIMIDIFPVTERYRGLAIGHALGTMLMSGTLGYMFSAGIKFFHFPLFPFFYIIFFSFIAFLMSDSLNKKDNKI